MRFIPSIMKAQSPPWEKAAALMERWINGPAQQLQGSQLAGKANNGGLLDIDNTITMDWLLQFARARDLYEQLISSNAFNHPNAMPRIVKYARAELTPGAESVVFGVSQPSNDRDRDAMYCNSRSIEDYPYLDDLGGALGAFSMYVIPGGSAIQTSNESPGQAPQSLDDSRIDITVTQASLYVRDSYDFNGNQPLGFWQRPDRVSIVSHTIYGDAWSAAGLAYGKQGLYCPEDEVEITNEVFRKFRDNTRMGQDFSIYSDLKIVDLDVPIKMYAIGTQVPVYVAF